MKLATVTRALSALAQEHRLATKDARQKNQEKSTASRLSVCWCRPEPMAWPRARLLKRWACRPRP